MNLINFCIAFIVMYVGHRVGDYLLQTDYQAGNKTKSFIARIKHCLTYSLIITFLVLLFFNYKIAIVIFLLTFIEHMIVDTRKPVYWWKNFLEKKIARRKDFEIENVPLFVIIEIDQTFHHVRILLLAILISLV
ncbi:DUF3307 domain-containing protein [Virgibacillus dakarensis]|nr:DUF3307 domain-containing protein [Virgibacillus dakarensis]